MDSEPYDLERTLVALKPCELSDSLLARLNAAMNDAAEAAGREKVVPFPVRRESLVRRTSRPVWGAAAAVALLGAGAALWLTPRAEVAPVAVREASPIVTPVGGKFSTAGFDRGVREATDEGLVWSQDQVPHRRVRVVYIDKVIMKNPAGETMVVERPRVEWLLVPEKMD